MKTHTRHRWLGRLAALIALAPLASAAAEAATASAAPPDSNPARYVLFTGCDIQIEHLRSLHHVRDVEGGSFVILLNNNQKLAIPMDRNSEKLKVSRTLVLTDRVASVSNYKYDRVYTPANDPQQKFVQQMRGLSVAREIAPAMAARESATPRTRTIMKPDGTLEVIPEPELPGAQQAAQMAASQASGSMDEQFYTQKMSEELALKLFDAIEVQFEVSAAKPIRKPYFVVTAKYHEKDDTKHVRHWLFAKEIDRIDATPRKVSLREGGFPPGFEVEDLRVHLYEKDFEIATDLSENRAALTRAEAHEYLLIEYLAAHKNDTDQPQVALAELPDDWIARRHEAVFHKTYYVKVDKTGLPTGAFEDEACATPVADATCAEILSRSLFVPALKKGQPVDGVARIVPARLAL